MIAAAFGKDDVLTILLDHGVSINAKNKPINALHESTALHQAVQSKNIHIVEYLLNKNIDVNMKDEFERFAIESAVQAVSPLTEIAISIIQSGRLLPEVLEIVKERAKRYIMTSPEHKSDFLEILKAIEELEAVNRNDS